MYNECRYLSGKTVQNSFQNHSGKMKRFVAYIKNEVRIYAVVDMPLDSWNNM